MWEQEKMKSFKDLLRWCNKKTLFRHWKWSIFINKGFVTLKLGCTLPNPANFCLPSSTFAKFYPITEKDRDLLSKVLEDMVVGPSKLFTRKTVVDEIHNRNSTNFCESVVGTNASQLFSNSICQPMSRGLYTRYVFDADLQRFKPHQNKSRSFEIMVMSNFQPMRPDCRIERSFCTTGTHKRMVFLMQMGFVDIATQCLKQWVVSIITVHVKRHEAL